MPKPGQVPKHPIQREGVRKAGNILGIVTLAAFAACAIGLSTKFNNGEQNEDRPVGPPREAPTDVYEGGDPISAGKAQERVEAAMQGVDLPVLARDVRGFFKPDSLEGVYGLLGSRQEQYQAANPNVPDPIAQVIVNCSSMVRIGASGEVPEGMVLTIENGLEQGNYGVVAEACGAAAVEVWDGNEIYHIQTG